MAAPIKKYKLGKIEAAIFQNEKYNSQSVKFQKSWMDNNKQWQHTDFFAVTDLRDLYALVGGLLMKQIKEEPMKPTAPKPQRQDPEYMPSPTDLPENGEEIQY